jgi:hypothetical protein
MTAHIDGTLMLRGCTHKHIPLTQLWCTHAICGFPISTCSSFRACFQKKKLFQLAAVPSHALCHAAFPAFTNYVRTSLTHTHTHAYAHTHAHTHACWYTASTISHTHTHMPAGTQLAAGRLVGSLSVMTAKDEDCTAVMLASWVSQVRVSFCVRACVRSFLCVGMCVYVCLGMLAFWT